MDSPVIMDTTSKFDGSLITGFPFDDQGFGRLGDIRSQLDNLATRHPEFADHLLGPPWSDVPHLGTLRSRRRGSGSGSLHQTHHDEDVRSQASGSSAASAASGASGMSSHGEPEPMYHQQEVSDKSPQYNLRNTVDIGQYNQNMDNAEKINREQRSASAPPENHQQVKQEVIQEVPPQRNQRFISRVDITPQFNQQSDEKGLMPKRQHTHHDHSKTPAQQQKLPHQQSNVRHIPIFVEGRDEPIIPKNTEGFTPTSRPHPSSSQYSTQFDDTPAKFGISPHFQKPMTFTEHFAHRPRDWSPHFHDSSPDVFDHKTIRKNNQPTQGAPLRHSHQHHQQQQPQSYQSEKFSPQSEYNHSDPQMGEFPSQSTMPSQQPEYITATVNSTALPEPKRKISTPKDPLERVDLVQKEVDSLTEQIKSWNGHSKADKQYIYLDEMLTRELIKLDDIETEGKDNVRQARKNAIKSIQNSISLLESKISCVSPSENSPLLGEQSIHESLTKTMEIDPEFTEKSGQNRTDAIPLPARPVLPVTVIENNASIHNKPSIVPTMNENMQLDESHCSEVEVGPMVETSIPGLTRVPCAEIDAPDICESNQISCGAVAIIDGEENSTPSKSGKSPKKLRKTKNQTPISLEPIPLPAADNHCLDVK